MVRNSKSALLALAAAGGLLAWRNRDRIQSWINSQSSRLGASPPMTGETRRMGQSDYPTPDYPASDAPTQYPSDTYRTEI